jgi:hypothetical protein
MAHIVKIENFSVVDHRNVSVPARFIKHSEVTAYGELRVRLLAFLT